MSDRRIEFDPNVRRYGFWSTLNVPALALHLGDEVTAFEPEDGIEFPAEVAGFWGDEARYVLLRIDASQRRDIGKDI